DGRGPRGRGHRQVGPAQQGDRQGRGVVRLIALDAAVAPVGDEQEVAVAEGGVTRHEDVLADRVAAAGGQRRAGVRDGGHRRGGRVEGRRVGQVQRVGPVPIGLARALVGDGEGNRDRVAQAGRGRGGRRR